MIQSGTIGKVSRVLAWSYKNWGYDGPAFTSFDDVPQNLDWNLWIGTAAMHPYKKGIYHQGTWRKQIDFGTGTLGDMGVHIFDTPYRALALTYPTWVRTTCRKPTGVGHPERNIVEYEFPGTPYTTDTMRWTWYDGTGRAASDRRPRCAGRREAAQSGFALVAKAAQCCCHTWPSRNCSRKTSSKMPLVRILNRATTTTSGSMRVWEPARQVLISVTRVA